MKHILWWICLLAAPAVLIAIELFHPADFTAHPGMYQFLSHPEHGQPQFQALDYPGPGWWFTLHMIQTPAVGLVAVGLWLLVDAAGGDRGAAAVCAWLARAATFVFLIYYTVLDAIGGIGLGRPSSRSSAWWPRAGSPGAGRRHHAAAQHGLDRPLGGRRRIVHQRDRVLGGVRGHRGSRCLHPAVTPARLGLPRRRAADRLRVGVADQPRQPAWADRLRPADHRGGVDLVGAAPDAAGLRPRRVRARMGQGRPHLPAGRFGARLPRNKRPRAMEFRRPAWSGPSSPARAERRCRAAPPPSVPHRG